MARGEMIEEAKQSSNETVEKIISIHFEPRLASLNLSVKQIEGQNLEQLKQSLETINDAISNPDSFGRLKLLLSARFGVVITEDPSRAHLEVGILPLLLERKKLILDRIRSLQSAEKIENLRDLVGKVDDETVRSKLEKEISGLEAESQKWHQQSEELRQTQVDMKPGFASITILERRLQAWQSFLQRESVATIVGSLLLFVIAVSLLIAMFKGVATSEIINNSFLVILGYFFGQTVSRSSNKPTDES